MNIQVWSNFSKRENSTRQPGGGQSIDVKLKDNCSIENPVFLLATGGGMPDYTYAEAFGHYYYVTEDNIDWHFELETVNSDAYQRRRYAIWRNLESYDGLWRQTNGGRVGRISRLRMAS